jgi:hypothetical protein
MPWLTWKAAKNGDGGFIFEFKIPNGGEGPWYWQGAGHKIGFSINVFDRSGRGYSMGEPYKLNYSRMEESRGRAPWLAPPSPLDVTEVHPKIGDATAFATRTGFTVGPLGYYNHDVGTLGVLAIGRIKGNEFDISATLEGTGDFVLSGYTDQTPKPEAEGESALVMQNGKISLHVMGVSNDVEPMHLGPGPHKFQLLRRAKGYWALVDGKVVGYASDPLPEMTIDKIGLSTPREGELALRELSYRLIKNP